MKQIAKSTHSTELKLLDLVRYLKSLQSSSAPLVGKEDGDEQFHLDIIELKSLALQKQSIQNY